MTTILSQCFRCKHFERDNEKFVFRCAAFPDGDGIPDEILLNRFDHRNAYEGDNGVRFEPIEDDPLADE